MPTKFFISALSSLGSDAFNRNIRSALHARQTTLKSSDVRTIQTSSGVLLSGFDIDAGIEISKDQVADWILDCLQSINFPIAMMVDELPDDFPLQVEDYAIDLFERPPKRIRHPYFEQLEEARS